MWIDQTSFARTEMGQGVVVICLLLSQSVLRGYPDAIFNDLVLHRQSCVFSRFEGLVLVSVEFVTDGEFLSGFDFSAEFVASEAGYVGLINLTLYGIILHDSVCDLEAGIDQFDLVLGALEHCLSVDLDEFIYISEAWGSLLVAIASPTP